MKVFAIDCETQISNKGDPFDETNTLVVGGYGTNTSCTYFNHNDKEAISSLLQQSSLVIGFNIKFDLHWLRRIGITFSIRMPVWDCQLAEFILSNQKNKYPSLEETASKYSLGHKLDVIKLDYWDKGIDTDKIPSEILNEYLRQDVSLTYLVYVQQMLEFKKPEHKDKYKLFRLQCYDLLVLEEMEYNGYKFDCEASRKEALFLEEECSKLDRAILAEYPDVPINLASNDDISCMLYGGTITEEVSMPIGVFKTGLRAGETKYRKFPKEYNLPRLVEPLRGSALAKEGYYGTGEEVLRSLATTGRVSKIIDNLLNRRGITKLQGTYYNGVPDLIEKHNWSNSIVHGQLNQCVAKTSRLTATKPNQQNMPGGCKKFCISRYDS